MKTDAYPAWVCSECGSKYGRRTPDVSAWHDGICGVCGKQTVVSEPRDFGHLRDEWVNERKEHGNG
jgi:rRNA maturation protein Nop10